MRRVMKRKIMLDATQRALTSCRKLPDDAVHRLRKRAGQALLNLQHGEEPEQHWRELADLLNLARALSECGILSDAESREVIELGHDVLGIVWQRRKAAGVWAMNDGELASLNEALWRYCQQIALCSQREYREAYRRTERRIRQAIAGNAAPGTEIIGVAA